MALLHPRTKAVVKPALLDNSPLNLTPGGNPRKELARWMTSHPYFAEAAVNRIWGYFFARGIVDPVDDFRSTNPPTHPELLAALAADFREHGHDLRRLMKTIVSSRTYQLSHRPNATNREDVINYSRSLARGLDAEVLLDAVADVTGIPETFLHRDHRRRDRRAGSRRHARDSTARSRHVLLALPGVVRALQSRRRSGAQQQAESQPGDACAGRSDLCGPPRPAQQPPGEAARIGRRAMSRSSRSSTWPRSAASPTPEELQRAENHPGATRRSRSRAARIRLGLDQLPRIRGESLKGGAMQHPASRRSFITAGSLGFLGLSLRRGAFGRGGNRFCSQRQSQSRNPLLARGRPQPHRHLGPQVEQQLQADLHQRAGHPDLGTAAEDGEAHGQVRAGALHAHARHGPSAGHALRHHRPRDQSGDAVPQPRLDHHQGNGAAQRRARARAGSQVGPDAAIRRIFPRRVSGRRLRSDVHPGSRQAGLRSDRPESAEERFAGGRGKPLGVSAGGGPALPRAERHGGAHQHGRLHRAGLEDDPDAGGARRVRPLERIRQDEGALRQGFDRPVLPAGAPVGRSRQPFRHRGRVSLGTPGIRTATTTRATATG